MKDYPWPKACAGEYVTRELAHAIGIITINWNWCEFTLTSIIEQYLSDPTPITSRLMNKATSMALCDTLLGIATDYETDKDKREHIENYVASFDICRENRNLIVHGLCVFEAPIDFEGPSFTQARAGIEIKERIVPITAELMVTICNETNALFEYGVGILDWGRGDPDAQPKPEPMPKKLPLPRKLTQILPARTLKMLQRGASQE